MSKVKITKAQQELIENELRRGTSKSRIANLLEVDYDTGLTMIKQVNEAIRPQIGDQIAFKFRDKDMAGVITKLLTNSAVVEIYWEMSTPSMQGICEDKTVVNFKDIVDFLELPEQDEDKYVVLDPQPQVYTIDTRDI